MIKTPKLVDLGLPSGNLWMTKNLGASCETDYGDYYQFGSLEGYQGEKAEKHSFWYTCPFNNEKYEFDEEYFKTNRSKWVYKNGLLKPKFDAVTQMYGNNYRMPTDKDFQELLEYTIAKQVKKPGKFWFKCNGILFTSKINGKTLFFPYSGYVWEGIFEGVGDRLCYLWSGRLHSCYPDYAYYLYCNSDRAFLSNNRRFGGFAIRGIKVQDE